MAVKRRIQGPANPMYLRGVHADSMQGRLVYYPITLSAIAGTVTVVEVPGWADLVKIFPPLIDTVYAFDEDPTTGANLTGTPIALSSAYVGDVAAAGQWEARVIKDGTQTIRLLSDTGNSEVIVAFSSGDA